MKYLISYFAIVSLAIGATGDLQLKQKTASGAFRDITIQASAGTLLGFDLSANIGKVNEVTSLDVVTLNVTGNVLPLPPGSIAMWTTADIANKPTNTLVCDGTNGTTDITAPTGATAIIVASPTPDAPSVTPVSGTYSVAQTVTATGASGAVIYYTTNATDPTRASSVYSAPLTASTTAEYRFAQAKSPGILSPITTRSYTINPATINFQAADAAGWSVAYSTPPTFDPVGSPETFTISRSGYDTSANATTVTETLTLMSRVRQVYPSQASLSASTVALDDFIYAGDTISGVTNNSTRAYPKPIAMWLNRDLEIITGSTHTLRMVVAHAYARNGRPVAAVRFRITDGTNTAEVLASPAVVSYTASGLSAPCFEGTVNVSTLTQGATLTIDAVIYPWVGPSFTVSTDADTYPSPNLSTLRALCNRTGALAPVYAYVNVGATGGTASTTAATAQADPFPTIAAAAAAIKTLQGTNSDRGIVRLEVGTHVHSVYRSTANTDAWPLTIEAANPANKATTIYQAAAVTTANSIPNFVVLRNLTILRNTSSSFTFLDQASANNVYAQLLAIENCTFSLGGFTAYNGFIYKCARVWFNNCDGDDVGQAGIVGAINKTVNAIGCTKGFIYGTTGYSMVASRTDGMSLAAATAAKVAAVGSFWGWNVISSGNAATAIVQVGSVVGDRGIAIVGNVVESWGTSANATLNISADNFNTEIQNAVMQLNSAIGERCNMFYLETATEYQKSGYVSFNVFDRQNIKSDVYSSQTVSGNWSARYKTGWKRNAVLRGGSNDENNYTATSWLGDIAALGESTGTSASPLTVNWTSDRSNYGTDAGGGDYTPGATNSLPTIPAGATPYAYDQLGRAIPTNGTAVVGAIQRP